MTPTLTTHSARLTRPVRFLGDQGQWQRIPVGPCLVEGIGGPQIDIVWGARGQRCAAFTLEQIETACGQGTLVLLD
jgi:hypothetical protein